MGPTGIVFTEPAVVRAVQGLRAEAVRAVERKARQESEWRRAMRARPRDPGPGPGTQHGAVQLKFSNLLQAEEEFLNKLKSLEKFNFSPEFKMGHKNVKDARVSMDSETAVIRLPFQLSIKNVSNEALKYVKRRKEFWKEIPKIKK